VATKEDSSFYQISLNDVSQRQQWKLPSAGYGVVGDGTDRVFVSHWGDASVGVFNVVLNRWEPKIMVGDNPNEMKYDAKGKRLFVACSDDNSVHVVHLKKGLKVERLSAGLFGTQLTGSGTNALCLMQNNRILLAANADNNALAVFDVKTPGKYSFKGFVPTGWYPTQVAVWGDQIVVANGKGFGSMANPQGPNPVEKRTKTEYQKGQKTALKVQYIGSLFRGGLQIMGVDQVMNASMLAKNTASW
jgi:DNA-binding beta-propeller fold protein YncE